MIRESDGIQIQGEELVVLDSRNTAGDINFMSHAHFDHLHTNSDTNIVCSELTANLVEARTEKSVSYKDQHDSLNLIPSGHILGSNAALVKGEKSVLYTGDFSLRDSVYLEGFKPMKADKLIIETTYGIPAYRFPQQRDIEKNIVDWIQDTDRPLFLFGYSLGKAQKIQKLVERATNRPVVAHGAVKNMNDAVEESTDMKFSAVPYTENKELLEDNGIFIGPTRFSKNESFNDFIEKVNGIKAGFSGWAATDAYMYRGGYDKTFPLSDHADFDDLVETVKAVDPEKVYTTHGFDEQFAAYLRRELGFNARALKKNQSSLTDFS